MDDRDRATEATLGRTLLIGAIVGSLVVLVGGLLVAPSLVTNHIWAAPLLGLSGAMAGLLVVSIVVRLRGRRGPTTG